MTDIISLLSTDGYIMCNKTLIKLFGADCAILIGELCAEYNYYKNRGELTPSDSFYSTQENIEEMTGLSPYSQRKAIKILQDNEILIVSRQGVPAKNYYQIQKSQLLKIFTSSSEKTEELEVKKLNLNNNKTNNKENNNNTISKDIVPTEEKPKRKSLYDKCIDAIDDYTDNSNLRESLVSYLSVRLAIKEKPIRGVNQWIGILNKLKTLESDETKQIDIVLRSIEGGWASFYSQSNTYGKKGQNQDVFSEYGKVKSNKVGGNTDSGNREF